MKDETQVQHESVTILQKEKITLDTRELLIADYLVKG
jgi:hypothetical protein